MYQQYPQYPQYSQYQQQPAPKMVLVPTVQDIERFQIPIGQSLIIMAQNEPVFARRSADGMGLVNTEYFRFEPYNPNSVQQAEYVTRAEFEKAVAMLRGGVQNEPTVQFTEQQ